MPIRPYFLCLERALTPDEALTVNETLSDSFSTFSDVYPCVYYLCSDQVPEQIAAMVEAVLPLGIRACVVRLPQLPEPVREDLFWIRGDQGFD